MIKEKKTGKKELNLDMAKSIDIYRGKDLVVGDVPITEEAVHRASIMKEDYIKLAFSDTRDYGLKAGDVIHLDMDYYLGEDYIPSMDNEVEYKYEVQFNAPWYNLSNYMFLFLTETPHENVMYVTRRESEWEFTGTAEELISLIIGNTRKTDLYNERFDLINTRVCPCVFDSLFYCEPTEVKSFSFSATDIISALNQISKEYDKEWWVEVTGGRYILHFGEYDNSVMYSDNATLFNNDGTRKKDASKRTLLRMGSNISKPSIRLNEDLKRYFFVYGSSRNVDQTITSLDVNAISTRRLSLDNPIDKGIGSGEEVIVFEDVYPKNDYQITRVDAYETTSETVVGYDKNDNPIYATYLIYQIYCEEFSDMVMRLIKEKPDIRGIEDIVVSGKKLSIKFIPRDTGVSTITPLLSGWEFEVAARLEMDKKGTQWYEFQILHQDINGYIVPNADLCPKGLEDGTYTDIHGNKKPILGDENADWVCFYNIKGAYVDANTMYNAKSELNREFEKYYANLRKNVVYTVSPFVDVDVDLGLGDAIELNYGDNKVITRVNGYTKHLDYGIVASYELSTFVNQGTLNNLKDEIKVLNVAVNRIGNVGTDANAVVDLINEFGKKHFLQKDAEDTAKELITFEKGVYTDAMQSVEYTPNFGGNGYRIEMINGKSYLTVDNAYIRNKAKFDTLEIRKVVHTGGMEIKSPASCEIAKVDDYFTSVALIDSEGRYIITKDGFRLCVLSSVASAYKCYFKATDGEKTTTNDWQVGDLALCHEFNTSGQRYYWRRVVDMSRKEENGYHWVALSYTDADGEDIPMQGDTIVCFGSSIPERQNAIVMASEGGDAPFFAQYHGINTFNVTHSQVNVLLSPNLNIIKGHKIIWIAEDNTERNVVDEINANTKQIEKNTASITIQSNKIENVVKKTSEAYDTYTRADFVLGDVFVFDNTAVGVEKSGEGAIRLCIKNVKKGDRIHIEATQIYPYFYTCDNDAIGAFNYAYDEHYEGIENYEWVGFLGQRYDVADFIDNSYDFVVENDALNLYIVLTDDAGAYWDEVKVMHIKSAISSESRIMQTADSITAKVGECGIDIENKTITLNAERTTVKGSLDIQKVACYYKDASGNDDKTKPMSEYNGSGNGTLVYYYPNGKKMREDAFIYDQSTGGVIGMQTTYFDINGKMAWQLSERGFQTTLDDYWSDLGRIHFTTETKESLKQTLKVFAQTDDKDIINRFAVDDFSQFNATINSQYRDYAYKIAKGKRYGEIPNQGMLFDGILIYEINQKSTINGISTYEAIIMEVTSTLGVLSAREILTFTNV